MPRPNPLPLILVALVYLGCGPRWSLPAVPAAPADTTTAESQQLLELQAPIVAARALLVRRLGELPGLAVAIGRDGAIVWSEGFGTADLERGRAATADTRFRAYSVAKTFTATLAVRLAERGVVDLDAPISAALGDLPPALGAVTLTQLLSHTGGVRNYRRGEWARVSRVHCATARQAIAPFRDDPLLAPPGEAFAYSSFSFVLASAVLEAAAAVPFPELLQREILRPSGMTDTTVDAPPYDPATTAGFYRAARWNRVRPEEPWESSCKAGAGGFLSSAKDLARFGLALLRGELVSPEGMERLFTPHIPGENTTSGYGLGWGLDWRDDGRLELASHSGGSPGGRSFLLVDPAGGIVVALAANLEGERLDEEAKALWHLFRDGG